ncbi:hypothetical protein [Sphingobacterium prati]|uniref:hypothetical protein n=1 Tax=Sphingobacterium prati TaxID=2737006 RepID=UPI001556AFDC|nr:hypothetical protein [Sphingobacterium prati]NPE44994.1 hypothetical protein [Sphingobacterium prati]
MRKLIKVFTELFLEYYPWLKEFNAIIAASKTVVAFVKFIKKRNLLRPISALVSELNAALIYAFRRSSKAVSQLRLPNLLPLFLHNGNRTAKITGAIMLIGIIVLIPTSFIGAFLTGLLHFTEKQNVLAAVSVAMLYFSFISAFAYMQYRILRRTAVA